MRHIRAILLLLILTMSNLLFAGSYFSNDAISLKVLPVTYTGLPDDYLYPSYLSDPLAVNSQIAIREYSIDEVHPRSDGTETHYDVTIGTRYNFIRFSPDGAPDLGLEMDWGMALTTFMDARVTDLLGIDGIYYFAVAVKPVEWASFRFTRHHICSHAGDQLDPNGDGNAYVDFDLNPQINEGTFVRDDYVVSAMVEPLYFLEPLAPELARTLRVYGDFSSYIPGSDLLGWRNLTPSKYAYIWYQYGAEIEFPFAGGVLGSLFAAGQVSHWQESAYAPNYSLQAGFILPKGKPGQRMKLAFSYYDGQSLMNNFRYRRARFMGITFTIDK